MLYNIILFFHILGTVIMFVAVGITLTAMISMLYAQKTEALQGWAKLAVKLDGLLPFSVILILAPGLYLVITTWGFGTGWIDLSLATLIVMTVMGPVINLRRLKAILAAANTETSSVPSSTLMEKVKDRTLWNSVMIMTMLTVGIIFLMTVKLAMLGSLVVLVIAILLGLIVTNLLLNVASNSKTIRQNNSKNL